MSEIVGFINFDREPAPVETLKNMCRALRSRAPDGERAWQRGGVGLGQMLLGFPELPAAETRLFSLDEEVWIAADCHLYHRAELLDALRVAGRRAMAHWPDEILILEAYKAFGDRFSEHLAGDFAIAIWDEPRQRLSLVRDQLGVRPLFYALTDRGIAFASHIDAILRHPGVNRSLDEGYIADFLLLGASILSEPSVYEQIKRVPPAHVLRLDRSGFRLNRYWSPPEVGVAPGRSPKSYAEEFSALFEKAVVSRMPAGDVALELSGGMDSGSVAAVASAHARKSGCRVWGFTNSSEPLLPADRERHFASMTASHLDIAMHVFASSDYPLFQGFGTPELQTAEPFGNPGLAQPRDRTELMLDKGCHVLLTGQIGDIVFAGLSNYYWRLMGRGRWLRLMTELLRHRRYAGSFSGTELRAGVKRFLRELPKVGFRETELPSWLNPDFVERAAISDRWLQFWDIWIASNDLPSQLRRPWLSRVFEDYEALRQPLNVRHPFADLRLLEFMLRVPNYMHFDKRILRESMQTRLPAEIVARRKQGLAGDIRRAKMSAGLVEANPSLNSIKPYVDIEAWGVQYRKLSGGSVEGSTWDSWMINFPIALAFWMNNNEDRMKEAL